MTGEEELERAQADGRITVHDADEVRRFGGFLEAMSAAGLRPGKRGEDPDPVAAANAAALYREHYPEHAAGGPE